ncbi:hypothetical protein [Flagellimonas sp. SN16]|uniref:hypothetical protein n=1 Tax=Flagellimonas sp. SN16 TaxID=3415142 RepID=UPI003C46FE72
MFLTVNPGHIIEPVERHKSLSAFVASRLKRVIDSWYKKIVSDLITDLDSAILAIEGGMPRIEDLSIEQAKELSVRNSDAIDRLDKIAIKFSHINFFENDEIKNKMKYLQKCLYRMDAKLHKKIYKESEKISTPEELLDGVISLNSNYSKTGKINGL